MKQPVINIFGGPGAGKSIACADIFSALKKKGINCEMAREFAKDIAWKVTPAKGEKIDPRIAEQFFKDQQSIFGRQSERQSDLEHKVDVIVTDSPLLNSIIYDGKKDIDFHRSVFNRFDEYENHNYFLDRVFPYEEEGRYQSEEEAKEVDRAIIRLLDSHGLKYTRLPSHDFNYLRIAQEFYDHLQARKINEAAFKMATS